MCNIIQHFSESMVECLDEIIEKNLSEGKDLGATVSAVSGKLMEAGLEYLTEKPENLNKEFMESPERKETYVSVNSGEKSILTTMGNLTYKRTCFENKETGKCIYLVDDLLNIQPHDRISSDVEEKLLEEAIQTSYRKSGEEVLFTREHCLSKQAVMSYISKYDFQLPEPVVSDGKKRRCPIIYIEADEAHVDLQKGGQVMPKLVYIHEGKDPDTLNLKKKRLKNVKYHSFLNESTVDLWEIILDDLENRYDLDYVKRIYISGDGAPWIKNGTQYFKNCKYVLDKYHLSKYVKAACSHMIEPLQQALKDAIDVADIENVRSIFVKILKLTDDEKRRERVQKARRYILNNWDGISICCKERKFIVGCSAEGHVSHVLASRLSSRPMGWKKQHVHNISKLIAYRLNGGNIIDLVAYRRQMELDKRTERLVKEVKSGKERVRKAAGAENVFYKNVSLPVLDKGKSTQLYRLFKELRGIY